MRLKIYWEKEEGIFKKKITSGSGILLNMCSTNKYTNECAFIVDDEGIKRIASEDIIKVEWVGGVS